MPTTPQVIVELGLGGGAGLGSPYLILGEPASVLGTALLAPATVLYQVPDTDLNSFTCSRGASTGGPLISYEAGQATVTLVNMQGQYDPDNYQGPFAAAAGWTAACQASGSDTSHFKVSTADSLDIYEGDWVRFTAVAGAYMVTSLAAPSGGSVQIAITPAAPSVIGSGTAARYQTMLTPNVIVRIRAVWGGVSYPVWAGYVTDWDPQYTGPEASYCVLTATDGLGYLSQDGLRTELGSPVGAGELSGTRVNRILDSAGWATGTSWRSVESGNSMMLGTTLGGTPLTELQLVTDSELGGFWMSPSGKATFRARRTVLTRAMSVTPQATFGSGPGELPYTDRDLEHASSRLVNQVTAGNSAGEQTTTNDSAAQARYGLRPFSRTDLLIFAGDLWQWVKLILYQDKDPEQWFSALTIDPRVSPAVFYPLVLGLDFRDRITIRRRPPGMLLVSRDVFIQGVSHEYRRGFWGARWTLQSAAKYNDFLILGTGIIGHDLLAF